MIYLHLDMDLVESIQMPAVKIDHAMVWPVTTGIDRVVIGVFVIVARMDFASFAGAVSELKRVVALDAGTIDCRLDRLQRDGF